MPLMKQAASKLPSSILNILYYSPSNTIGGAELSLLDIIKQARERGHNIYIALPKAKYNDYRFEELLKPHCNGIFQIHQMLWHRYRSNKPFKVFINYIYHIYLSCWHILPVIELRRIILENKIDIIHTNTILGIDAAIAGMVTGRPHIWHVREIVGTSNESIASLPFWNQPVLLRIMTNHLADTAIANSKYTADNVRAIFSENKIKVIYNCLPNGWLCYNKRIIGENMVVGSVASVTSVVKNHVLILAVAKELNYMGEHVRFHIFGSLPKGESAYYQELKKKIKEWDLNNTVKFMGHKDNIHIYNDIDILFHPSNREGFGRVIIEAMGRGIPVVAARGGGTDELIIDNETGIKVDVMNPKEIAMQLVRLKRDNSLYSKLSLAGYDYASSIVFKRNEMWSNIEACYNEVLLKKKWKRPAKYRLKVT